MCSCNQGCNQDKCKPIYCFPEPKPNYVLGYVSPCPPQCGPYYTPPPAPCCGHPAPPCSSHPAPPCCGHPAPPCCGHPPTICQETYDIIEYCHVQNRDFNILLNECGKSIVGFFITFVDCRGNPIRFDDTSSTLRVEGIYQYQDKENSGQVATYYNIISDTQSKYYYTYCQQSQNGLPYNNCLWTLYTNTCNPLKLSFHLVTSYTEPIYVYINLFMKPINFPSPVLAPVVDNCIDTDVCDNKGHIRWMVSFCCS